MSRTTLLSIENVRFRSEKRTTVHFPREPKTSEILDESFRGKSSGIFRNATRKACRFPRHSKRYCGLGGKDETL